ncbi:uncharacterized protein SPPG_02683 [Spizellomyces punctatus DAOM BR117]|uniref:ABC transporter domain-containing protein n=1 Tax=Spizellomyces punctatus (strain DAOM BR117) TaxID=645134 RepID=A0A0L0HL84_SPIPD|nr:uncharacterized protein SPPG_02683 [Spizellomyces punctatus DAOM BR117]KND02196.1 hypothetical protein SPPG_02683 [Spizellomyces punctatus DAOM BR117]|eukprot:XP_016610235.1 hypothetical protein SPPG_02683 [Spizellomyces punctatus DAOM BR117]
MDNFDHVEPADISVRDLYVSVGGGWQGARRVTGTEVLRNVGLHVPSGKLLAIMGGSGSGKTTLLNAMAGRVTNVQTTGQILINNRPAKTYIATGRVAYVQQSDQLLPYLTVRETLRYAARLRLPNDMPRSQKYKLVEDVILELGLKECADTIVGDEWRKGISGGEKRRVSVGVQLLLNPSIIFMDEPTTGLDAFTSHSLIETLVSLCRKGRTICVSIHQPRSDIFDLFDSIVLLSRGDLVYSGARATVLDYFAKLGYDIPDQVNPADFLIDVTSVDNRDEKAEEEGKERVKTLVEAWKTGRTGEGIEMEILLPSVEEKTKEPCAFMPNKQIGASFLGQTQILAERTFRNLLQDRLTLWGSVLEVLTLATAVGYVFYKLDETQSGILGRKSMLYITASVQNYLGLMFMIYKLSMEMKVFDRERLDKMYGVIPYLLGWLVANFFLYVVLACLFSVILYFMSGLRTDEMWHLGVFAGGNVLMQFVTIGWAYFCISWARDFATASLIGNSFFTFLSTSSGFFIQVDQIPVYLRWFKEISYITYGYRLLATNEFTNNEYACPELGTNGQDPRCQGESILKSLGFKSNDYTTPIVALIVNYAILMFLTGLVLRLKPHSGVRHASAIMRKNGDKKDRTLAIDEEMQRGEASVPRIDIRLDDVSLYISKKAYPAKETTATVTPILQNITAEFPSGQLSVILGASGAGKSTLLNLLMGRPLHTGPLTQTTQTGRILYKGVELDSSAQIASICSLVVQDDNHLLPALTARETLRYAALLRLPREMSVGEKIERAEKVLFELGLKDCADRVVGGEGVVKGLSGGEKRRLSIGIQMLTNPAVLVIDEPTSGLDAYTSHNLMTQLKEMASTGGRTIIVSIHQPRSDIVKLFDQILLLARGGRPIYSGPARSMIPYLASLNHVIPPLTNPADFALDLSSVDLRNAEAEERSRKRVDELVVRWTTDGKAKVQKSEDAVLTSVDFAGLQYRQRAPLGTSLGVLIRRSIVNMRRQVNLAAARIMQVVALGIIFTLYFARLSKNQPSVQARMGLLQQQGSLIFVGMLNCIAVFPQELNLMKFEYRDNVYSVASFFFSYLTNELPFEIASALIYSVFTIYVIGLQASLSNFLVFFYVVFCFINTGESIGIAFCAMVNSVGFSVQIMSTVISLQVMMSGFLSVKMPAFLAGINYAFLTRYVSRITASQEFDGLEFYCSDADVRDGICLYRTGEDALRLLDFESANSDWAFNMTMVAVLTVLVRAIAYLVLWGRMKRT